jgi:hypothetical protein
LIIDDPPGPQFGAKFRNYTRIGKSFDKTVKPLVGLMWKKGVN